MFSLTWSSFGSIVSVYLCMPNMHKGEIQVLFILLSLLPQVHSLFQNEFSTECDLVLPLSFTVSCPCNHFWLRQEIRKVCDTGAEVCHAKWRRVCECKPAIQLYPYWTPVLERNETRYPFYRRLGGPRFSMVPENLAAHRLSNPRLSVPQRVAIPPAKISV